MATRQYDFGMVAGAIKRQLKKRGLSYRELAEQIGMSESGIKKLMTGDDITLARLQAICGALEVDVLDLLEAAWAAPPTPYSYTEEQEEYLEDNEHVHAFLYALKDADFDAAAVARTYELDERSVRRYVKLLEEQGFFEVTHDGRILSDETYPYRTRTRRLLPFTENVRRVFLDHAAATRGDSPFTKIRFAGLRMSQESAETLDNGLRDVLMPYGAVARRDELSLPDDQISNWGILVVTAPWPERELVRVPPLDDDDRPVGPVFA